MLKLLIADGSEIFADALAVEFGGDFELEICYDGNTALEILQSFRPDALILNLQLPYTDGLTVLQKSAHQPRVILAVTPYLSDYVQQRAVDLGVQYIVRSPTVKSVRIRLMDMLAVTEPEISPERQVAALLHVLSFRIDLDGYRQLFIGIPIFAKDPAMRLSKELYPAIAEKMKLPDPRTVEHSIRKSIADAFAHRDPIAWEKFFPGRRSPPTNKAFISRLAEMLER